MKCCLSSAGCVFLTSTCFQWPTRHRYWVPSPNSRMDSRRHQGLFVGVRHAKIRCNRPTVMVSAAKVRVCVRMNRYETYVTHMYFSIAHLASSLLLRPERTKGRLSRDRISRVQKPIRHESKLSPPSRRLSLIEPKTQAAKLAMERWMQEAAASQRD